MKIIGTESRTIGVLIADDNVSNGVEVVNKDKDDDNVVNNDVVVDDVVDDVVVVVDCTWCVV